MCKSTTYYYNLQITLKSLQAIKDFKLWLLFKLLALLILTPE